jgi:hypothetical protein
MHIAQYTQHMTISTALHFLISYTYHTIYTLLHVKIDIGDDLLQLSDRRDISNTIWNSSLKIADTVR